MSAKPRHQDQPDHVKALELKALDDRKVIDLMTRQAELDRDFIGLLLKEVERLRQASKPKTRGEVDKQRNDRIADDYRAGMTQGELARKYKTTVPAIRGILRRRGVKRHK